MLGLPSGGLYFLHIKENSPSMRIRMRMRTPIRIRIRIPMRILIRMRIKYNGIIGCFFLRELIQEKS